MANSNKARPRRRQASSAIVVEQGVCRGCEKPARVVVAPGQWNDRLCLLCSVRDLRREVEANG